MSLRKRRIPQSSPTSSPPLKTEARKQYLHQHAKLVREVNRATGDDGDDDKTREMKKIMMDHQMKKNNELANLLLRILFRILVVVLILYIIVLFNPPNPTDEPSVMDILVNAFRILLGMKGNQFFLSSSHKIVASTTISKITIDKVSYPTWHWQKGTSKRYLVPPSSSEPVKQILHETMKFKHERGVEIDLFHRELMRDFMVEYGHECDEIDGSNSISILQKFDEFNNSTDMSKNNGPKTLWLWCMIYTGEAFGHLDIDRHIIEVKPNFLRKISLGEIENVLIDPTSFIFDVDVKRTMSTLSLSTSILFVSSKKSRVAKEILRYILSKSTFDEEAVTKELIRLIDHGGGGENWSLLSPHCTTTSTDPDRHAMYAKVCSKVSDYTEQICCNLTL